MEATHDSVVDALKALSKRVSEHKAEKLDDRENVKQGGPVVTGHAAHAATALIEAALGRKAGSAVASSMKLRKMLQSRSASAPKQGLSLIHI